MKSVVKEVIEVINSIEYRCDILNEKITEDEVGFILTVDNFLEYVISKKAIKLLPLSILQNHTMLSIICTGYGKHFENFDPASLKDGVWVILDNLSSNPLRCNCKERPFSMNLNDPSRFKNVDEAKDYLDKNKDTLSKDNVKHMWILQDGEIVSKHTFAVKIVEDETIDDNSKFIVSYGAKCET